MRATGLAGTVAAGLLALALTAAPAEAQEQKPIVFDARGGVAVPTSDLSDVTDDVGWAQNAGVGFGLSDRFFVRVDGGAQLYRGFDVGASLGNEGVSELLIREFHVHAGGMYYLLPRESGSIYVSVNGMGGATNLQIPRVQTSVGTDAVEIDVSELYPSFSGGGSVGYAVADQVDIFLNAQGHVTLADEDDTADLTQVFNDRNPGESLDSVETLFSFPITAGVRLTF